MDDNGCSHAVAGFLLGNTSIDFNYLVVKNFLYYEILVIDDNEKVRMVLGKLEKL